MGTEVAKKFIICQSEANPMELGQPILSRLALASEIVDGLTSSNAHVAFITASD